MAMSNTTRLMSQFLRINDELQLEKGVALDLAGNISEKRVTYSLRRPAVISRLTGPLHGMI